MLDPKLIETYNKLGIPLDEQKMLNGIAVDAEFDSVSVATTFREELKSHGVIFCSFSEAAINHPDIVKKYLQYCSRHFLVQLLYSIYVHLLHLSEILSTRDVHLELAQFSICKYFLYLILFLHQ